VVVVAGEEAGIGRAVCEGAHRWKDSGCPLVCGGREKPSNVCCLQACLRTKRLDATRL
jgi:hypothetical protein